jgi:Methyltransferase domain
VLREVDRKAAIERAIHRRHVEGGREGYAQIRAPLELYAITRLLRPTHVVETGVSSGVSSTHFLMALRSNRRGHLHSIDLPLLQRNAALRKSESPVSIPPGRSSGWAVPPPLLRGWDLRLGATQVELPKLVGEIPAIDIFLHDDLHTPAHLAWELRTIRALLHPGSVVLADNTQWTGAAFPEFAREIGVAMHARGQSDLVGLRMP